MLEQKVIDAVNQRLKVASIPVRVRRNGNYLVLRANLPRKPGEGSGFKQRDLSLGIPATKAGLNRAEREAKRLGVNLTDEDFDWGKYDRSRPSEPQEETTAALIVRFKPVKMKRSGKKKSCSEATWKSDWLAVYEKLPQSEPLSENSVIALLNTSEEDSWTRRQYVMKLQALCRFAGLDLNLKEYSGDYEPEPRNIPSDELIEEWRERIPNASWRWAYGVMATFGVRPHEIFFSELIDEISLQVHRGKTGPRISHAIRPEWVNQWGLMDMQRPAINRQTLK